MGAYFLKRLGFAILTIWIVVTLNFVLFRALPGDAVSALRCKNCTVEFKEAQRRDLGLDRSLPAQYRIYLTDLAHGDLGNSVRSYTSVRSELSEAIRNTLPMVLMGTIFAILLGTLTGVIAAWRRGTFADRFSVYGGLTFYSMPPQWLGLILILFVAQKVGLPSSGIKDPDLDVLQTLGGSVSNLEIFWDRLKHLILPALTLGVVLYGDYTLIVRSAMLETLGEDYILTARAKGLSTWRIVWKHGFRNALLPVVTLVALSLGFVIGGAITIEYVFSYPGIGFLTVEAIDQRDYPVLQGVFLLIAVSVILFNLVADFLYFRIDPRVTAQ